MSRNDIVGINNRGRGRRNTRTRTQGGHTHNYLSGPDSQYMGGFSENSPASIGRHKHRLYSNDIPPHTHPIYPNEHGEYTSEMMVDDIWEGGPPMTVPFAQSQHGFDPSLSHSGTHQHGNYPGPGQPQLAGNGGPTTRRRRHKRRRKVRPPRHGK